MGEERLRADVALVARGLAASRERAREAIEAGLVTVNGTTVAKPAQKIGDGDVLCVLGQTHPYVSRGGLKLEKALRAFGVDATGLVCADIGASTGGFTDVLLRNGARRVYAIDVGTGQLHPSLLNNPRVTSMEHVNARTLSRQMFPELPTLAVMDVSFISIRLILPALTQVLGPSGRIVTLVKPQFEAGRQGVGKGGIVTRSAVHRQVLGDIVAFAPTLGWRMRSLDFSPVRGGDGNLEFLAEIVPEGRCDRFAGIREIDAVIEAAKREKL